MMEITAEIRALIDKAAAGVELAGDEYIDPADGLIHCKKCGGQRQTVVPCFGKPGYFMPRCICQCQREAEEQRKAAEERQRPPGIPDPHSSCRPAAWRRARRWYTRRTGAGFSAPQGRLPS